ncbi:MAG TPA: hypothetical protein VK504_24150 [Vicinamibacterales bacterium]|jgi:hypothetical protein|nr:hypothetical protein [Vicinamibacterales bacterium]
MTAAVVGLVVSELLTLIVIGAAASKAPDDFYRLVFLMAVVGYRSYRQRSDDKDSNDKIRDLPSDRAAVAQKVHNIAAMIKYGVDVILMISLLVIAWR